MDISYHLVARVLASTDLVDRLAEKEGVRLAPDTMGWEVLEFLRLRRSETEGLRAVATRPAIATSG